MNPIWSNLFKQDDETYLTQKCLNSCPAFSGLSKRELGFIEKIVHPRHFREGEKIFSLGEVGFGLYMVGKGKVEIFVPENKELNKTKQHILDVEAGDFFGEMALIEESSRRPASARAIEQTFAVGFFQPDLAELSERNPRLGLKVVTNLSRILARRLRETGFVEECP